MCTLTYLPKGKNSFFFTHNRDERPWREFINPEVIEDSKIPYVSPRDMQAGGTWVAVSENRTACILNGAFGLYKYNPPYKHSRGLVIPHYFEYNSFREFVDNYEFDGIEPFSLFTWDNGELFELRWDEKKVHWKKLDETKPHIFSSSTLYNDDYKATRREWFADWHKEQKEINRDAILDFHNNGGKHDRGIAMRMNRGNFIKTVCISCIDFNEGEKDFHYFDLVNEKASQCSV